MKEKYPQIAAVVVCELLLMSAHTTSVQVSGPELGLIPFWSGLFGTRENKKKKKKILLCANLGFDAGVPYAVKRLPPSVPIIADTVLYTKDIFQP